jgi:hypothetical protein
LYILVLNTYESSKVLCKINFGVETKMVKAGTGILDFKQVFQFDSTQIFQILKKFRKMQTRYKIFQKVTFFLDRVLSHAFKLFVLNSQNSHNYGRK